MSILKSSESFGLAFLTENERKEVLPYLQEIHLEKGQPLFQPGDESSEVFFIQSGQLGVQTRTGFEDKQQVVALLDPGAPVGEKGVIGRNQRGMTVIAIEDSSLLVLKTDDFEKIESLKPKIAIKILKKMLVVTCLRLQSSSDRLAHVL